jgi:NTP pyrophosphatase (non-canonical NTP hydrolase)
VNISEFQSLIERIYYEKDKARGIAGDLAWLMEEVGELSKAIRLGEKKAMAGEFADVFAWLCTLASISGVNMEEAASKYAAGCPKCGGIPCRC